jgi:hypothetical protein
VAGGRLLQLLRWRHYILRPVPAGEIALMRARRGVRRSMVYMNPQGCEVQNSTHERTKESPKR